MRSYDVHSVVGTDDDAVGTNDGTPVVGTDDGTPVIGTNGGTLLVNSHDGTPVFGTSMGKSVTGLINSYSEDLRDLRSVTK